MRQQIRVIAAIVLMLAMVLPGSLTLTSAANTGTTRQPPHIQSETSQSWIKRTPESSPTERYAHAMAYDSNRELTVFFGGIYSVSIRQWDTWEWDGSTWAERAPVGKPAPRNNFAMAYDSAREVTVLFGGNTGTISYKDDTWEWDGTAWTQLTPTQKPSARSSHAMAYDSARGVTVLFGGYDGGYLDDTWEWDGTAWTQHFPAQKPPMLSGHAMAYDSAHGVTVLFGGYDGSIDLGDTWEWDGTNWTQQSPGNAPAARSHHAMAYDSAREVTVLFGGRYGGKYGTYLNDTWEWDGATWVQRTLASVPVSRFDHAMVYDSARDVIVLFGGAKFWKVGETNYFTSYKETWEYVAIPMYRIFVPLVARSVP